MKKMFAAMLCLVLVLSGCTAQAAEPYAAAQTEAQTEQAEQTDTKVSEIDDSDYYGSWDSACIITLSDTTAAADGEGVSISGSTVTVNRGGTYLLRGELRGQVIVEAEKSDTVRLVLDGVDIYCEESAPLYVKKAEKVIISLAEGTESVLSDGGTYKYDSSDENEPSAAVYSKSDLTVNGGGALTVNASSGDGITSRDTLKITGGTLSVTSADDALMGRDAVLIAGGTITLNADDDAVKATNDSGDGLGIISILDGTLDITAGGKGISSLSALDISGGTITISSDDDSVHSNKSITFSDGTLTVSSGDDGLHADDTVTVSGGSITVAKSYEGLEAQNINISGGEISITASDDGLNGAGGNDSSSFGGRPGQNGFSGGTCKLTIDGGRLYIDAMGDGIDVNGTVTMNGGLVIVNGPDDNSNGALDYDGGFEINGGTLIAVGSSGMLQSPDAGDIPSLAASFSTQQAGELITISDSSGTVIAALLPTNRYQSVVFASESLAVGEAYTISVGGTPSGGQWHGFYESASGGTELTTVEMDSAHVSSGSAGGMFGASPGGMPGGMRPGQSSGGLDPGRI